MTELSKMRMAPELESKYKAPSWGLWVSGDGRLKVAKG